MPPLPGCGPGPRHTASRSSTRSAIPRRPASGLHRLGRSRSCRRSSSRFSRHRRSSQSHELIEAVLETLRLPRDPRGGADDRVARPRREPPGARRRRARVRGAGRRAFALRLPPGHLAPLRPGRDLRTTSESLVTLMTIHNAKGLEFGAVFLIGMEEGDLPARPLDRGAGDRGGAAARYVGMTRAKERLTLTHTLSRSLFGTRALQPRLPLPRRVAAERDRARAAAAVLVVELRVAGERGAGPAGRPVACALATGDSVRHASLGEGVVTAHRARRHRHDPLRRGRHRAAAHARVRPAREDRVVASRRRGPRVPQPDGGRASRHVLRGGERRLRARSCATTTSSVCRPEMPPDRVFAAWDDGEPGRHHGVHRRSSSRFPAGSRLAAGITWVGVLPSHRRRGVLTELMRQQLDDVHERGEPLAILWASEPPIYGRFGYGIAAPEPPWTPSTRGFCAPGRPGPARHGPARDRRRRRGSSSRRSTRRRAPAAPRHARPAPDGSVERPSSRIRSTGATARARSSTPSSSSTAQPVGLRDVPAQVRSGSEGTPRGGASCSSRRSRRPRGHRGALALPLRHRPRRARAGLCDSTPRGRSSSWSRTPGGCTSRSTRGSGCGSWTSTRRSRGARMPATGSVVLEVTDELCSLERGARTASGRGRADRATTPTSRSTSPTSPPRTSARSRSSGSPPPGGSRSCGRAGSRARRRSSRRRSRRGAPRLLMDYRMARMRVTFDVARAPTTRRVLGRACSRSASTSAWSRPRSAWSASRRTCRSSGCTPRARTARRVGGAGAFPFEMTVPGALVPDAPASPSSGRLPTHRRRGVLRR